MIQPILPWLNVKNKALSTKIIINTTERRKNVFISLILLLPQEMLILGRIIFSFSCSNIITKNRRNSVKNKNNPIIWCEWTTRKLKIIRAVNENGFFSSLNLIINSEKLFLSIFGKGCSKFFCCDWWDAVPKGIVLLNRHWKAMWHN